MDYQDITGLLICGIYSWVYLLYLVLELTAPVYIAERRSGYMSKDDNNVTPKQYAHIATRVLNRAIKKREQQIASTEAGNPTSKKSLAQLKHELDVMMNELMERTIAKNSEPKEPT
jgi:hypothetical protein